MVHPVPLELEEVPLEEEDEDEDEDELELLEEEDEDELPPLVPEVPVKVPQLLVCTQLGRLLAASMLPLRLFARLLGSVFCEGPTPGPLVPVCWLTLFSISCRLGVYCATAMPEAKKQLQKKIKNRLMLT